MYLSVFSPVFAGYHLDQALEFLKKNGVNHMELGCGGYPGTAFADAKELVKDGAKLKKLLSAFDQHGVSISALSVHGNCVHPDKKISAAFQADFEAALQLAELMKIETVVTFSGCPGDGTSHQPNWVTCAWPNEYRDVLEYQWKEVLVPYWKDMAKLAARHGVQKIALEMHPGFCVYNPATLLKLRKSVGEIIGANFDPSHLIWQGIDCVEALSQMKGAVHFFHAKDTELNARNSRVNGVLDTGSYEDVDNRSWVFRTVGYGSDALFWKKTLSALSRTGYDGAVSVEHEDSLMSPLAGLKKGIEFLQPILIEKNTQKAWWI